MSTEVKVAWQAHDPSAGLTIREIREFLANAEEARIPEDTPVRVNAGMKSQIKKITATA